MNEGFDMARVFRLGFVALLFTFFLTLNYALAPANACLGIGCSPELNVGRFHFTTTMLILLVVQIVGIISLIIALFFTKKSEHSTDAFAALANNSPIFKVQQTNTNASPF